MTEITVKNMSKRAEGVLSENDAVVWIKPGQTKTVKTHEKGLSLIKRNASLVSGDVAEDVAEEEDRGATIRAAISSLTDTDFNGDGSPNLDKLNDAMPEGSDPVSGDERDAIWAEMS